MVYLMIYIIIGVRFPETVSSIVLGSVTEQVITPEKRVEFYTPKQFPFIECIDEKERVNFPYIGIFSETKVKT